MMWSGASNAIPSGFVLCDGNNSTPDLRNRFVVGAGNSYNVDATGGSKDAVLVTHTHNLQNHVHGVNLTTNDPGTHTHSYSRYANTYNYGRHWQGYPSIGETTNTNTGGGGAHTHTVSGNTGQPSTNTTDTLGESATNKNLPPYYALCYIMKT